MISSPQAPNLLGTQMKATGEAMSIGSNLEECLLKAVRSLEIGGHVTFTLRNSMTRRIKILFGYIEEFRDDNIFAVAELLRRGAEVEKIHEATQDNGILPHLCQKDS